MGRRKRRNFPGIISFSMVYSTFFRKRFFSPSSKTMVYLLPYRATHVRLSDRMYSLGRRFPGWYTYTFLSLSSSTWIRWANSSLESGAAVCSSTMSGRRSLL